MFGIQIKVYSPSKQKDEWLWCSTSSGERYEFATGEEAHRMKEMCYPESTVDKVRVAEIKE